MTAEGGWGPNTETSHSIAYRQGLRDALKYLSDSETGSGINKIGYLWAYA
jgi:hypothetical protein